MNYKLKYFLYFLLGLLILYFTPYGLKTKEYSSKLKNIYYSLFPLNLSVDICDPLENDIKYLIKNDLHKWSISIINSNNNLVVDINGDLLRIPASNQKLFSTAYALDILGPNHRFSTKLYKNIDSHYKIIGSGDPDLSLDHLKTLSNVLLADVSKYSNNTFAQINIYDTPTTHWWPSSWPIADRYQAYGAPITRLALTSNSNEFSILNPTKRFSNSLKQILSNHNVATKINNFTPNKFKNESDRLLVNIQSAPLYALLGLANAESHNFTSEILLRNASSSWDAKIATNKLSNWTRNLGINNKTFIFRDGSGLSRSNLVTTNTVVKLLLRMKEHKHFSYYLSSLSIPGIRGTLKSYNWPVEDYTLFAKTGTLTDVRSLSGYLLSNDKIISISFITNGIYNSEDNFSNILYLILRNHRCLFD